MERPIFSNLLVITQSVVALSMCYLTSNTIVRSSLAIELPQYTVVWSESEFEFRLYRECSWMTALVRGTTTSFQKSTKDGFHKLYQYIHGANSNSTVIAMSSPVLTTIMASSPSSTHVSEYQVRLYLSEKYDESSPPQPLPELSLQLDKWRSHCVAVRKFSGFAEDDNVDKEAEALRNSLSKHLSFGDGKTTPFQVEKSSYMIAQYNSSRHLSGRLNEVWLSVVSGFSAAGCLPRQGED